MSTSSIRSKIKPKALSGRRRRGHLKPMRRNTETADLKFGEIFDKEKDIQYVFETREVRSVDTLDLTDPLIKDLAQKLGGRPEDYRLAGRLMILERNMPNSTLPERIAIDYLQTRRIPHYTQTTSTTGARLDILLDKGGYGLGIEIDGSFWHSRTKKERDLQRTFGVVGQKVNGLRVKGIVRVTENDLLHKNKREQVMGNAVLGLRG